MGGGRWEGAATDWAEREVPPKAASLPGRQELMHTRTHFRIQLNRCQETKQVTPSSPQQDQESGS